MRLSSSHSASFLALPFSSPAATISFRRFFDRQIQPRDARFRVLHLMQVI
jgi:hypothetical protein